MVFGCLKFLFKLENFRVTASNLQGQTEKFGGVTYVLIDHLVVEKQLRLCFYRKDGLDLASIIYELAELSVHQLSDRKLWFSDGSQFLTIKSRKVSDSLELWRRLSEISYNLW
jgi:hypothetical protein